MADRVGPVADATFDPARFARLLSGLGHNAWLGLGYVAHGPDWVDLRLPYADTLIGDPDTGVLASGPIVALMDMATSMAVWTRVAAFMPLATLDLRVDYLRAAVSGRAVIGHGECYRLTRRIGFVRGQAHDGDPDDPVAHVAGTFMFTDAA
ncbi:PaaI family thioesterase [Sphingomonas montana]|uniref:PaaI family thioesterase n=1 Tax=Sphingomonas montana TaxID=1843236 RepID=UPI00096FDA9E|nr:PaaI family thioesterase [Sphingomonas montana]